MAEISMACPCCLGTSLWTLPVAPWLKGVTSDERPWPRNFPLQLCQACGHVHKTATSSWKEAISRIYAQYEIYHLSGGSEKKAFAGGGSTPRSLRLVEKLNQEIGLQERGLMLDVGSGKGAFLAAFGQVKTGWELAAEDLDDRFASHLLALPGVKKVYAGPLATIAEAFDLISLIHVLEHIAEPIPFLRQLAGKLNPGGLIFCEVPFFPDNPFDLLIQDHCAHFLVATISQVARQAGLEVVAVSTSWIDKEISLVLRAGPPNLDFSSIPGKPILTKNRVCQCLRWLEEVYAQGRAAARPGPIHILGTSIAGTWLASLIGNRVACFVDEDPTRVGKNHLGIPIRHVSQIEGGTKVFLPFPPTMAQKISARLEKHYPEITFVLPPALAG